MIYPMQLLNTREIANLLRLKPATVARYWRKWQGFPAPIFGVVQGARPRWRQSDIISWLETNHAANDDIARPKIKPRLVNLDKTPENALLNNLLNFG